MYVYLENKHTLMFLKKLTIQLANGNKAPRKNSPVSGPPQAPNVAKEI